MREDLLKTGIFDLHGTEVMVGGRVSFSFGIPPISVPSAPVVIEKGVIWVLTPGHNPTRCRLSKLNEYVGGFYVEE
jgi:hypothetical protein